jgi:hypothetical protein
MIVNKIKEGWGFDVGPFSGGSSVVLSFLDDEYAIEYWPTDNPPTIEEIEAVILPETVAQANWPVFRLAMIQSQAFLRIVNINPALFVMLNSVMWLIDSDTSKLQETVLIWNQLATAAQPTSEEIIELNDISSKNNIPLKLNESGFMII